MDKWKMTTIADEVFLNPVRTYGIEEASRMITQHDQYCYWKKHDGYCEEYWSTTCNNNFEFNDGGPIDNGFIYCPYCGKKLKESV